MEESREDLPPGNTEEDWRIFEILCKDTMDESGVDITTNLRSEIAALQCKRDLLTCELNEMRQNIRQKEQRCLDLQAETDQLREQTARQNAIIVSLKKRVQELEERERNLFAVQGRNEITIQTLQRDNRYFEEKLKETEKRCRNFEVDLNAEQQKRETIKNQFVDLIRRLSVVLCLDFVDDSHLTSDNILHKTNELVQELNRLRNKTNNIQDNLTGIELELKTCKDSLDRTLIDRDNLQRQSDNQTIEINRLKQEKDSLEIQQRTLERQLNEIKEKLSISNRSLGSVTGNIAQQETIIAQLKDDIKLKDERIQRLQNDNRHLLESLAILLSTPARFVESLESSIKDRIREIITENKDKTAQLETLRNDLHHESQQLTRQIALCDQANTRIRILEDDKANLEAKLRKFETDFNTIELSRDNLKRDKTIFMNFLERLARALNMDEIAHDVGVDLHTESLLLRAEQLARLESDKLVDKTALVYQLQRRNKALKEQVQRKDLHLDLLRRKLALQEDNTKTKCLLQSERDEAQLRIKKLLKQIDQQQIELFDANTQIKDLKAQIAEAADYKITALERGRKIEDLQKRLLEAESLRTKYNRKITILKEQVRTTGENIEQERNINEHSIQLLRDEIARLKDNYNELQRHEQQLQNFKNSVARILGVNLPIPDYELITRLQKLVDAHHDFTLVSRRYDDPVLRLTTRSPTAGSRSTRTPDRSRYDDSGFTDTGADLDDIDDDLFKRQTRPL